MFHKLRLKLTLFNASIILVLFVLLIAGTYHFSRSEIKHRSEDMAHRIMEDIKSGMIGDLPPRRGGGGPPPGPNFFFVKVAPDGNIFLQSFNQPLSPDLLLVLVKETLAKSDDRGILHQGDTEYPYWKAAIEADAGTIILFQDVAHENNILRIQLTALILTGLACLILSLAGSFFMANRAMAPIQKAWQKQIDFVSDASHELRTPLTIIQTNLDIVMGNPEEAVSEQIRWLNNIQEGTVQMTSLVDSLLFLARADSHQQLLIKQPFNFGSVLAQAAALFEPIAAAKGVDLSVVVETASSACGDEARIKQVLGVLLDNAIRHTPADGKVTVRIYQSGTDNVLTVTDTGEGIAPAEAAKIFDRFYQTDKSRSHGGAGLGLAIAKCIVEAHSGTIQVSSTLGAGTTFSARFPMLDKQCAQA